MLPIWTAPVRLPAGDSLVGAGKMIFFSFNLASAPPGDWAMAAPLVASPTKIATVVDFTLTISPLLHRARTRTQTRGRHRRRQRYRWPPRLGRKTAEVI